ncbi:hypothetical protein JA9_000815 [Meyerozyma sp. JA9]|nr:hypothetical protein JA9_000815 [Meyerozyma sp. JA9]
MVFKTLSSKAAARLDAELMSTGAFSLDQLMELAGLAVASAVHKQYPPSPARNKLLVLVGPGNNGGDGLVASRHLRLWGYEPVLFYPKKSTKQPLYQRLVTQLQQLNVPEIDQLDEVKKLASDSSVVAIIDTLFGFSFKPPIRPPFDELIGYLSSSSDSLAPIVSVDIPSGWDVDNGPTGESALQPKMLVSLTAPKPCATSFNAKDKVHYLGGRFINDEVAAKYDIADLIKLYKGDDLIVKL